MIADKLTSWDAADLARILAERFADAEDLAEAFPSIEGIDSFDSAQLPDFIEKNWMYLLSYYDVDKLESWLEEKDYEEEWEKWKSDLAEQDYEYAEWKQKEYCWSVIEVAEMFRCPDLAEIHGFPSKKYHC